MEILFLLTEDRPKSVGHWPTPCVCPQPHDHRSKLAHAEPQWGLSAWSATVGGKKEYGTEPAGVACMPARVRVCTHAHTHARSLHQQGSQRQRGL